MIPSSLRRFRRSVVRRRYLGAVAVLFLLSVAYLLLTRLSTPFSAQVETTSISFSVGDWRGSGGIFNSAESSVTLTMQVPCVTTDEEHPLHILAGTVLRDVKMLSLDIPPRS